MEQRPEMIENRPEMMENRPEMVDINNLTDAQESEIERVKKFKIKSHMLNRPCACGSGKKFKNCHAPIIRMMKNKIKQLEGVI